MIRYNIFYLLLFPLLLSADTIKVKTRAPQNQQAVFQYRVPRSYNPRKTCRVLVIFGGRNTDGEAGPLCLRKNGTFQEAEKLAFPGHEPCTVRPGTIGDQFECDKFLYYTSAWRHFPQRSFGLAAAITDYRIAFQEKLSGNGVVNVLAAPSGAVCAYAFALKYFGEDILEFRFHPDYPEHLPELVRQTAADYEEMFDAVPVCAAAEDAELKLEALRRAGFSEAGGLSGRLCYLKSRI